MNTSGMPTNPAHTASTASTISGTVIADVRPGIGEHDQVIVWGGGLWDWLDPLTAIEALPLVLVRVPNARLFFMGFKHPKIQLTR